MIPLLSCFAVGCSSQGPVIDEPAGSVDYAIDNPTSRPLEIRGDIILEDAQPVETCGEL